MKNSVYHTALLFTVSLLTVACTAPETTPVPLASAERIPVKVMALTPTSIEKTVVSSGQFTTNDETVLSFKTGGVISKVFVKEGDPIKKGQLLAVLDLTEIAAQVNQAQIAFEKAQRDHKRVENLYRDSVASAEQFQNSRSALDLAQQQLNAARFNLSYSEIRAGTDGVVLRKLMNEGQIAGPGLPVLQINGKGTSDWLLRVTVSDRDWALIALGDSAQVQVDALQAVVVPATVHAKSESVDPVTGALTLDLRLLNRKSMDLASGMFGKALIFPKASGTAWKIPYEALLDGNASQGFVFVTNDGQTARKVPVVVGQIQKNEVCIDGGLSSFDYLIVSGSAYLTDRSPIQVIK